MVRKLTRACVVIRGHREACHDELSCICEINTHLWMLLTSSTNDSGWWRGVTSLTLSCAFVVNCTANLNSHGTSHRLSVITLYGDEDRKQYSSGKSNHELRLGEASHLEQLRNNSWENVAENWAQKHNQGGEPGRVTLGRIHSRGNFTTFKIRGEWGCETQIICWREKVRLVVSNFTSFPWEVVFTQCHSAKSYDVEMT